jgi:hypothetical protein
MAGSAVMILHGLWVGSPLVTDTGCCPSAARRSYPGPAGPQSDLPACIVLLRKLWDQRPAFPPSRWRPWLTTAVHARPLRHGTRALCSPGRISCHLALRRYLHDIARIRSSPWPQVAAH